MILLLSLLLIEVINNSYLSLLLIEVINNSYYHY